MRKTIPNHLRSDQQSRMRGGHCGICQPSLSGSNLTRGERLPSEVSEFLVNALESHGGCKKGRQMGER